MIRRATFLGSVCVAVSLAASAHGYVVEDRWTTTATDGYISSSSARGVPATVTWSFAPQNTSISGVANNLISFLDDTFGGGVGTNYAQRPWFSIFEQSFGRIDELSGVDFVYEPNDDGARFSTSSSSRGVLGVRGDIRLGGKSYGPGDTGTLASNFYPDYGEMIVNTDKASFFANSANDYRAFRNTLMHEVMHGLGISHVASTGSRFLIEPILSTAIDGPQLDDLLAIQRLYGDAYEQNGGNDSPARATTLGSVSPAQPLSIGTMGSSATIINQQTDFLSIDDDSDVDFFKFSLSETLDVTLDLTPMGAAYSVGVPDEPEVAVDTRLYSDLTLALFDGSGAALLATSNVGGLGAVESIAQRLDAGDYFARVTGAQDEIQLYQLAIQAAALPPTAVIAAADFDEDGDVDATDLAVWQFGFGSPLGALADADDDLDADGADFLAWQRQLSTPTPTGPAGAPVPEPGAWMLAVTGTAALVARWRGSKSARR